MKSTYRSEKLVERKRKEGRFGESGEKWVSIVLKSKYLPLCTLLAQFRWQSLYAYRILGSLLVVVRFFYCSLHLAYILGSLWYCKEPAVISSGLHKGGISLSCVQEPELQQKFLTYFCVCVGRGGGQGGGSYKIVFCLIGNTFQGLLGHPLPYIPLKFCDELFLNSVHTVAVHYGAQFPSLQLLADVTGMIRQLKGIKEIKVYLLHAGWINKITIGQTLLGTYYWDKSLLMECH